MSQKTKKVPNRVCDWKPDDDGIYHTTCDQMFCFNDDGPIENKFAYCPYCGGRMRAGEGAMIPTARERLIRERAEQWWRGLPEHIRRDLRIVDAEELAAVVEAETREQCAEIAREHSCLTYSELCDCGGKIATAIRAAAQERT